MAAFAQQLVAQAGGTLKELFPLSLNGFLATLTEPAAIDLAGHPDVAAVEQEQWIYLDDTVADTQSTAGEQLNPPWGLDRIDQRGPDANGQLDGKYVYPHTGGGVRVYVVDSGINIGHVTFTGRARYGVNTIDPVVPGQPPDSSDCNGHGTHVAGIAGGGHYGAAKGVELVAVKVFDCAGKTRSGSVEKAIEWVRGDANPDQPTVMNLSLGMRSFGTSSIDVVVKKAVADGITTVVGAGNGGTDARNYSPAHVDEGIIVGATNSADYRGRGLPNWEPQHPGSNYGANLDLFAPGELILSAGYQSTTATKTMTGTSMAAPHVSGAAALVLATHPDPVYTPSMVERVLVDAATTGVVQNKGAGSPDKLLFIERPPANAPTTLTAVPKPDGSVALSWTAPPEPGMHYLVSQRNASKNEPFKRWKEPVFGATTATATGLAEGDRYEFRVAASNSMGIGPESNIASAVAHTNPPAAPTNLTATANPNGTITLNWTAPAPGLWYWIYQRDVTAGEADFTKLALPLTTCCTFTAGLLTHDHEYEYKVSGINIGGEGPASNTARARSTYPKPGAPANLTAVAGDGQVTLTWTASPTPNMWYWVYQRNVSDNETTFMRLPLPITACCTMTAGLLTNDDEYEFKVTATGQSGESVDSNLVRGTPQKPVPGQVTGLTAAANTDGTITLRWTAPPGGPFWYDVWQRNATDGGSFVKLPLPNTECCTMNAGLLTHNKTYEFKVAATNGRTGPLSSPVQATSRYSPPGAPTSLVGRTAGDGTVALTWTAPGPGGFYYWVYYRNVTAGQSGFTRAGLPTDKTWASIGPLVHNNLYEFKVTAESQGGEGPASSTVQVTSLGGLPQPPSGLSATAGDGQVTLRWTASPTANVWYYIDYRPAGGAWQSNLITTCCAFTLSYLTNGTTYEFRMRATNASGNSASSNMVTARPMPPLPQPPSGLTATAGDGQVTLRWTASTSPNVWYWLELRANGGAWQRSQYPITTCCSHQVSYLMNGTSYEFRVLSTNLAGDSAPSNLASARPMPPLPQPPTGLTATAGDNQVTLRWNASPTSNVWYWIEYRESNGVWQRLPYPYTGCCSFTVQYLRNGVIYDFRVRATNLAGDSAPSTVASARPVEPPGCSTYAFYPQMSNLYEYQNFYFMYTSGPTYTRCAGPVTDVRVTATLYRNSRSDSETQSWGSVASGATRAGWVNASALSGHIFGQRCAWYTLEARVDWTYGGSLRRAVHWSQLAPVGPDCGPPA